jgi:thiamine monophosphate synthase
VLALGGLQRSDLGRALDLGAWGIAGISAFSAF